jgi:hypothetical protein
VRVSPPLERGLIIQLCVVSRLRISGTKPSLTDTVLHFDA